jgi:hypothetical protein
MPTLEVCGCVWWVLQVLFPLWAGPEAWPKLCKCKEKDDSPQPKYLKRAAGVVCMVWRRGRSRVAHARSLGEAPYVFPKATLSLMGISPYCDLPGNLFLITGPASDDQCLFLSRCPSRQLSHPSPLPLPTPVPCNETAGALPTPHSGPSTAKQLSLTPLERRHGGACLRFKTHMLEQTCARAIAWDSALSLCDSCENSSPSMKD